MYIEIRLYIQKNINRLKKSQTKIRDYFYY